MRIYTAAAATLDNGLKNGAALAGISIAQEQPVLLSKSSRPNGALDQIIMHALKKVSKSSGCKSRLATSLQPEALGAVQEVTNELKYLPEKVPEKEISERCGLQRE